MSSGFLSAIAAAFAASAATAGTITWANVKGLLVKWIKEEGWATLFGWGATTIADLFVDNAKTNAEKEKQSEYIDSHPIKQAIRFREAIESFEAEHKEEYDTYQKELALLREPLNSANESAKNIVQKSLAPELLEILGNYIDLNGWDGNAKDYYIMLAELDRIVKSQNDKNLTFAYKQFDSIQHDSRMEAALLSSLNSNWLVDKFISDHADQFGTYEDNKDALDLLYQQYPILMQATESLTSDSENPMLQAVLGAIEGMLTQLDTEVVGIVETNTSLVDSIATLAGTNDDLQLLHSNLNAAIQNIPTTIATMAPTVICSLRGDGLSGAPVIYEETLRQWQPKETILLSQQGALYLPPVFVMRTVMLSAWCSSVQSTEADRTKRQFSEALIGLAANCLFTNTNCCQFT